MTTETPNIFEQIVGRLPKGRPDDVEKLNALEAPVSREFDKMPLKEMVLDWQKDQTPEKTGVLLRRMEPTMKSAINSYAQGMEDSLRVKTAWLTLNALKAYDPAAGTEPTTYVFHSLKRLNRLAADRSAIIHYPEQTRADARAIEKFKTEFEDEHGREPSDAEILDRTGISRGRMDRAMNIPMTVNAGSFDRFEADETGGHAPGTKDLTDEDYFEYVYTSVGPVDQKIMEWTSGYHRKPVLSNNEIAARLKMSPAAVSQRKSRVQRSLSEIRGLL